MEIRNVGWFYPVSRFRKILTQEYISGAAENGLQGFPTYEEAENILLHHMDTDNSDYEVCVNIGGKWYATRDGKTTLDRAIP